MQRPSHVRDTASPESLGTPHLLEALAGHPCVRGLIPELDLPELSELSAEELSDRGLPRAAGHAPNGHASPKQVNFLRALAAQAGMSYEDLGSFAAESFGKADLRQLTKHEASQLIESLKDD